jgi:MoaA/NifB/PqqE/SkfB family radical SAM enzyme
VIVDRSALSETQRRNLQAGLAAYRDGNVVSSPRPAALFVELTRNCISRCRYCCRKGWTNDSAFDMSRDTFRRVVEECAPYASFVDVRSFGESLMVRDLPWYLEQTARVCPNLRITTTLGCGSQGTLRALVDHDVFVSVSFDAANQKLYERYRRGIKYDVVMRNMEFVSSEMLAKHGSLLGRMRIGIAPLYGESLDHVDGVLEVAYRLRIPEVRIVALTSSWYDPNLLVYHPRKVLRTLHKAIEKAETYGIELQFATPILASLKLPDKVCELCFKPWFYSVITFDGTMRCCDWQAELEQSRDDFGNIRDGVESAWNGEVAKRVRHTHVQGQGVSSTCRNCYRIGRYSDHEHDLDPSFRRWLVAGADMKRAIERSWRERVGD